eukprot:TRINITY_DN8144_c0_g1_i1.p1 TRINITY_DN8144_c0_g1~~TRINITY_DN8144_c0_g1_i1.p1  ORF type:complete len:648 (+),score=75.69 TRINITY_DN8144_c0_g1_i1:120-2063(+)
MVLTPLSFTLLLLLLFCPLTNSQTSNTSPALLQRICDQNKAQDPQSFDVNFVDVMETVFQNISQNGFGFALSSNRTFEQVYALGQCFNYISPIVCRLCYAQGRVQLPFCLPATGARVYMEGCFVRYSNYNFSEEARDNSDTSLCGSVNSTSDAIGFSEKTRGLVSNLTLLAPEERDYYKIGNVTVKSGMVVYGFAQCWRSLNKSRCKECLETARDSAIRCLPNVDGRALNAGCYVRYSTNRFYEEVSVASGTGGSSGRQLRVALGCIFATVAVLGGAIIWGRRSSAHTGDMDESTEFTISISESHLNFKYEDLRKATNDFDLSNKLGQGAYGSVYKGILPDGREIAVKRLFFNTTQWVEQFFNEVNLISGVQHKNLVKLLGCSIGGPESLLVYEYLRNTSLDHFLFDSFKKVALDWGRRFDIIVGTAEGLAYLHEASEVRIIHRDIKASNILLDERFKPKIADFGLARYFGEDQSHLSTGVAGTLGYMAPEYVVHGQLTEKADIYSYGVLVLEVVTGRKNNNSISTSEESYSLMSLMWAHYTSKTLTEMIDPHLRGQCSEQEILKVFHVGLLCTQALPSLRPPMWKVVEMLTSKTRDLPLPTQPPFINIKGAEMRSAGGSETSYLLTSSSKSPVSVNQMSVSIIRGR